MVVSQIAGLATAFGTGELSGAGFGPNYTILMKLGYEFFAPRILEEMEKNPNVFFQDTLWFKKFQKQIKLYSDNVMKETLDTLLSIPQETIDRIANRFSEQLTAGLPPGASPELGLLIKALEATLKAFSGGITLNVAGLGSLLPPASAISGPEQPLQSIPQQPLRPQDVTDTIIPDAPTDQPPAPALTQAQLLQKYKHDFFLYRQKGGLLTQTQFNTALNTATNVRQWLQNNDPVPTGATTTFGKNVRRQTQSVRIEVKKKQTEITFHTHTLNGMLEELRKIPPDRFIIALWKKRNGVIQDLFNLYWIYTGYDAPRQT